MQGGRDRSTELRKYGGDAIHGLNHVGGGLTEDGDEDSMFPAEEAQIAEVFDGIVDLGDVTQAHRSAYVTGDDQRLILVGLEKLVAIGNGPRLPGIGEGALRQVGV